MCFIGAWWKLDLTFTVFTITTAKKQDTKQDPQKAELAFHSLARAQEASSDGAADLLPHHLHILAL